MEIFTPDHTHWFAAIYTCDSEWSWMVHCTVVPCWFSLPWWGYIHYVYMVIVDTLGSTGGTCTTIGDTVSLLRTHAYIAPCPYHDVTAQAWFKLPRVLHGVSLKLHKHHTRRANKIHCRHLHTTSLRVGCQATNHFKLVRHKPCFGNLIWNTQSQLVQQVERNYKYGTDPHASSHNIQRCSQV